MPLTPSITTTRTVVTVRDYDADGDLRAETITDVKTGSKTTTERTYDTDGMLRTEKITQVDTAPATPRNFGNFDSYPRYRPPSFLGY